MDLRTHYPFSLLQSGLPASYPSLQRSVKTEVAVIGAGITGALVAWQLQKKGVDCVVLDKRHVATGSTAASTSLIQYEIDQPLFKLMKMIGEKKAVRAYEAGREAVAALKSICEKVGDANNFRDRCSLQFASYKKHVKNIELEYAVRKKHGFAVDLLEQKDIHQQFGFDAPAALFTYEAGQLDAYLLTHQLLQSFAKKGGAIYDHTAVASIVRQKNKVRLVTADGFTVDAKQVVIACGYESSAYLGRSPEKLRCTYALVSEPLHAKELWKDNCLIWETADPYLYIRTTKDNRILVGGKDTEYIPLKKQLDRLPLKSAALAKAFQKLFPHLPLRIDFHWAGAFATTADGLPYIGTIPSRKHTWFALGYGGNGISFSLIASEIISEAIIGKKHPDADLFSFDRG